MEQMRAQNLNSVNLKEVIKLTNGGKHEGKLEQKPQQVLDFVRGPSF